ncbi:MAG: hypothetical protein ACTSU5_03700 [Promethearchaeota archaeon]
MVRFSGELLVDDDGQLVVKMPLSAMNPELFEIGLVEILEEFINRRVRVEVLPLEPRYERRDG